MVWLPEPVAPPVTVSHDALLVAVDVHPAGACIAKLPEPPATATLADVGEIAKEHEMPASVTVKVLPAIVTVPLREELVLLAATPICTVPLPDPEPPDVTVIHDALLVAVRLHPLVAVTAMLADPPEDVKLAEAGVRL
jgi:hypothetical protein